MTLDQLTAFVATVEHEGFKPAARALGKHASTISTLVTNLEDTLGLELFIRQPRSLLITEQGQELYAEARSVLREAEHLQNKADSFLQGVRGKLAIAVDNSVWGAKLSEIIAGLQREFPTVRLNLMMGDTLQVRSWLLNSRADIGLSMATHTNVSGLDVARAFTFGVSMVAPPNWDVSSYRYAADLRTEVQLCYQFFTDLGQRDAHVLSHRTVECNDGRQMLDLVHQGVGYAILPGYLAAQAIESGYVQELVLAEEKPAIWYATLLKLEDSVLDPVGKAFYSALSRLDDRQ